jgi:hypothetical protein
MVRQPDLRDMLHKTAQDFEEIAADRRRRLQVSKKSEESLPD